MTAMKVIRSIVKSRLAAAGIGKRVSILLATGVLVGAANAQLPRAHRNATCISDANGALFYVSSDHQLLKATRSEYLCLLSGGVLPHLVRRGSRYTVAKATRLISWEDTFSDLLVSDALDSSIADFEYWKDDQWIVATGTSLYRVDGKQARSAKLLSYTQPMRHLYLSLDKDQAFYVTGLPLGLIRCDPTGEVDWIYAPRGNRGVTPAGPVHVLSDDSIIGVWANGAVERFTAQGEVSWRQDLSQRCRELLSAGTIAGDRLVIASRRGENSSDAVFAIDLMSGETLWELPLGQSALCGPFMADDGATCIVVLQDTSIVQFNLAGCVVEKFIKVGCISKPVIDGSGNVVFVNSDGALISIQLQNRSKQ